MTPKSAWMQTYQKTGAIPIAVPDGHLEGFLKVIFNGMNLDYPVSDNGGPYGVTTEYKFEDGSKQKVYVSMHRPKGIVEATRDGHFVLGISGKDWWISALPIALNGDSEKSFIDGLNKFGLYKVADLEYRPTSVVVAVHKDSKINNLYEFIETYSNGESLENVASELMGLSKDFLAAHNIKIKGRLIDSDGKTESYLRDGIAGAIVEISETGHSVVGNGGKILSPYLIKKTTPHAVGRSDARCEEPVKRFLDDFRGRLNEVLPEMKQDGRYEKNFKDHMLLGELDGVCV